MRASTDRVVKARVFRAFGERTLLEKNVLVGYDLNDRLFDEWWLTWFWNERLLSQSDYKVAGLSLLFMAAMVEAGDA